jgi:stage V sporulation protein D (sporulation-specific penicillin-binding protein)
MRIAQSIGIDKFYQYARDFGFYERTGIGLPGEASGNFHENPKNIDMIVASFGQRFTITPIEITAAYCAIANGGELMRPRLVKELTDAEGNVVARFEPEIIRKVVSGKTSETMRGVLEEVVKDGTGRNAYVAGYRVAGKTGTSETTDKNRFIASFAAFAPADDPVICVFVMLDNPKGDSHMGGAVAAPVARKIIEDTLVYMDVERKYSEKDQKQLVKQIAMPDLRGKPVESAVHALKESGFKYRLQSGINDMSATVAKQNPPAGSMVIAGATVMLYTSKDADPTLTDMPDLAGMDVPRAIAAMGGAGLNMKASGSGAASSQGVAPAEKVEAGSIVDVSFRYMENIE